MEPSDQELPSYKELYKTISEAIAPLTESTSKLAEEVKQLKIESAGRPTKEDFETLRNDVKQSMLHLENRTFTRDVLDLRFQQLSDQFRAHEDAAKHVKQELQSDIDGIKTAQSGIWDKMISRWSTIVLLVWIVIQMIPYLAKIFS